MNIKRVILAVSALGASALWAATPAFDTLELTQNAWYSSTATASPIATGGAWSQNGTSISSWEGMTSTQGGETCVEVDADADAPLTFAATTKTTTDPIVRYSFKLIASTVPASVTPSAGNAKIGFAIRTVNDARVMQAYLGSTTGWVTLTPASGDIPTEGTLFTLNIFVDQRDSENPEAKFTIGDRDEVSSQVVLKNGDAEWSAIDSAFTIGSGSAKLVGSGYFNCIDGDTFKIAAEKVVVPGGSSENPISIKEDAMENFRAAADAGGYKDLDAYLSDTNETNSKSNLDNYTLFGKSDPDDVKASDKVAIAALPRAENYSGNVVISVPKVNGTTIPSEMYNKVSYTLMGSSDGSTFSALDTAKLGITFTKAGGSYAIPLSVANTYKFFKIKVSIDYTAK